MFNGDDNIYYANPNDIITTKSTFPYKPFNSIHPIPPTPPIPGSVQLSEELEKLLQISTNIDPIISNSENFKSGFVVLNNFLCEYKYSILKDKNKWILLYTSTSEIVFSDVEFSSVLDSALKLIFDLGSKSVYMEFEE